MRALVRLFLSWSMKQHFLKRRSRFRVFFKLCRCDDKRKFNIGFFFDPSNPKMNAWVLIALLRSPAAVSYRTLEWQTVLFNNYCKHFCYVTNVYGIEFQLAEIILQLMSKLNYRHLQLRLGGSTRNGQISETNNHGWEFNIFPWKNEKKCQNYTFVISTLSVHLQ